ncbi:WD40-repeat-containing domain protein, partial [Blastocladiella britannica]
RSTVTRIWSDFSAASAGVRDTILLGLVDASCMRQITTLRAATAVAHRMDLVTALPVELSLRIMQCLDARSLARAAQVSRSWAPLANADAVWQRMCLQHIDKKCAKCGWGLPRLTRKRRRIGASDPASDAARSAVAALMLHLASSTAASVNAATTASTTSTGSATVATTTSAQSPPPTTTTAPTPTPTTAVVRRSWKAVYAERLVVGRNWKNDRHVAYALVPPVASLQPRVTAVHLDEPYLLTSAMDGLVRLWHVETRTCVRTLAGHRGAVTCVHFDEPHGLAVTGGMDGTVRLWNWAAGTMVRTLAGGHSVPVTALYFANGVLATADAASLIRVWDFAAKSCFALNHGNMCAVTKVALCRGSLFSAGDDGVVRMWDLNTRSCI